jgi:prevent-host-death family protein
MLRSAERKPAKEDAMEEIAISKFKATCLEVLERVRRTRTPVRVTRFGKPVAEVGPPSISESKRSRLGSMAGTIRIKGDIVSPASAPDDWEVLRS